MRPHILRVLIGLGHIGGRCLRNIRDGFCGREIGPENLEAANEVLKSNSFRYIREGYDYEDDLWALARCSFREHCEINFQDQVEQYYKKLLRCLEHELGGRSEHDARPSRSVTENASIFTRKQQTNHHKASFEGCANNQQAPKNTQSGNNKRQKYKQRRSVRPDQLVEYAKKIRELEIESEGFTKEIRDLSQKLEQERQRNAQHCEQVTILANEKQQLQLREQTLLEKGNSLWTQHEQLKQEHTHMLAQKQAEYELLMRKLANLEQDYAGMQKQNGFKETTFLQDQAKLCGAIKELYAIFVQSNGAQKAVFLTPVTQQAVGICG